MNSPQITPIELQYIIDSHTVTGNASYEKMNRLNEPMNKCEKKNRFNMQKKLNNGIQKCAN